MQQLRNAEQREYEASHSTSLLDAFPSAAHWHIQTCFRTSCAICISGLFQTGSGLSPLSCLPLKRRNLTPAFAMGFLLASKRMLLESELWSPLPPAQPGTVVFLTSWGGRLWPHLPSWLQHQGQAEITSPRPGCHHHAGSSAQHRDLLCFPTAPPLQTLTQRHETAQGSQCGGKPRKPGDCCYLPAGTTLTHAALVCLFCRLFTF